MAFIGTFQFRRSTAAEWASSNPVLLSGELGIETDTSQFKLGDGSTAWNALPYGGLQGPASTTPGPSGEKGWSPVLAVVVDGERRVFQVSDWVGGAGAKPATGAYIGASGFVATPAQAVDVRGPQGAAGVNAVPTNAFSTVTVDGVPISADTPTDTLTVSAGSGIILTPDAVNDALVISARQKLLSKISALFASPANSTAVTVVVRLSIPANYMTAGFTLDLDLEGTQSNAGAIASNVVGSIAINGTQLVSAAVAAGTTAQTNRSMRIKGGVMWDGSVFRGNILTGISGVLPVGGANVTGIAAAAATAHTVDLRVQNSVANAANIIRAISASIKEV